MSTAPARIIRSGYARDIMPERLDAAEKNGLAVPIGNDSGGQEGRLRPKDRKYRGQYKVVNMREAEMNLHARIIGALPTIPGGLDEAMPGEVTKGLKMSTKSKAKQPSKSVASTLRKSDYDPLGNAEEITELEPGSVTLAAEEQRLASPASLDDPLIRPNEMDRKLGPEPQRMNYLEQRQRVTLEMQEGTMSMSCIDVKEGSYGVTILLPIAPESSIFTPKPGTSVKVSNGAKTWNTYYPGTNFEFPELKLMTLVFIKAEE